MGRLYPQTIKLELSDLESLDIAEARDDPATSERHTWKALLSLHSSVFQALSHFRLLQGFGEFEEITIKDTVHVMGGEADAVIGDAALGEVVGADFLRPVTGANQ